MQCQWDDASSQQPHQRFVVIIAITVKVSNCTSMYIVTLEFFNLCFSFTICNCKEKTRAIDLSHMTCLLEASP
jgi:hypothetical protein